MSQSLKPSSEELERVKGQVEAARKESSEERMKADEATDRASDLRHKLDVAEEAVKVEERVAAKLREA